MNIAEYIMAGKAIFTLQSDRDQDKRRTFKCRADAKCQSRFFVDTLVGPDNRMNYRFLGWFYVGAGSAIFHTGTKSYEDTMAVKMFSAFLSAIFDELKLPEHCLFHPSGKCARCGRLLTTPESIERGLGPECATK